MRVKKILLVILVIPVLFALCGFLFDKVTVLVDTENNHIYEYTTADDLLSDFEKDTKSAEDKYKGNYYVISGKIESISEKGDIIEIFGSTNTDNHIICSCSKNMRSSALKYSVGNGIGAFGKISVDLFDKEIHINADNLISAPSAVKTGTFYLLDGTSINKNSMRKRTLNNGTVSYSIPVAWKEVEKSITEEKIGTIEGYQYVLNRLPDNTDNEPESFFVCYFKNDEKLESVDDKKETKLIEKAIINNISGEGKGDSAKTREVTTYYGSKYDYYLGSYTDALDAGNNGYRVEYIFQKNGDDGLVMYLYVYKDAKHISDVMFVTRFLEITGLGNN